MSELQLYYVLIYNQTLCRWCWEARQWTSEEIEGARFADRSLRLFYGASRALALKSWRSSLVEAIGRKEDEIAALRRELDFFPDLAYQVLG